MLEGKALVVAIMMLTAAPLVVTDDGRAIVGEVTSDVTDMFIDEKVAEDPKRNEVLDDAVEDVKEKESKLDKKELTELDKSDSKFDEKECYYLDEIKDEKDYDKEGGWETEEELFAALEKLATDYPKLSIGSYPFDINSEFGVNIVVRGNNSDLIDQFINNLETKIEELNCSS